MKILLLNDVATPSGGAEILTIGLRDELRKLGHDARLFASSARYGSQPIDADYQCFGTTGCLRTANRVFNVGAYRSLRTVLSTFQPDVVHVRMMMSQLSPSILPLLRSVPSIYHAAWHEAVCPIGTKLLPNGSQCQQQAGRCCLTGGCLSVRAWTALMLQQCLWKKWSTAFDRIVANSAAVRDILLESGVGPAEVVWNGVPEQPPRPPLANPPTIAYCGRLSREKGVDVLLEAFAIVAAAEPTARLLIVGDGADRNALAQRVTQASLDKLVTMHPHDPNSAAVERILAPAWVQVVPSMCIEGFGLAAAEAMMRGTAVIASRAGGLAEVVEHNHTGRLVTPGDVLELADGLLHIIRNRDTAEQWGRAGRERALAFFNRSSQTQAFLDLYSEISAHPHTPARNPSSRIKAEVTS